MEVPPVCAAVDVRCRGAIRTACLIVQVCILEVRVVSRFVCKSDGFASWVDGVEQDGHEEELCMVADRIRLCVWLRAADNSRVDDGFLRCEAVFSLQ